MKFLDILNDKPTTPPQDMQTRYQPTLDYWQVNHATNVMVVRRNVQQAMQGGEVAPEMIWLSGVVHALQMVREHGWPVDIPMEL